MATTATSKTSRFAGVTDLSQARAKVRDIAADTLPKIADAAQHAGESIARVSASAGEAAARKLRTVPPSTMAQAAATLAASGMLAKALRFAARRPLLFAIGGIVVARAGLALLRNSRKEVGEGSDEGQRDYRERTDKFLSERGEDVDDLAREAGNALDSEEGAILQATEAKGRSPARR